MDFKAEIVDIPDQIILSRRETGMYSVIPKLMGDVYQVSIANGYPISGPPGFICHEKNMEESAKADKEGTADVEVFLSLSKQIEVPEGFTCYTHKRGKCVKTIHRGAFEEIHRTYEPLVRWIVSKKIKVTGLLFETYMTDPSKVAKEDNVTEVYIPIE